MPSIKQILNQDKLKKATSGCRDESAAVVKTVNEIYALVVDKVAVSTREALEFIAKNEFAAKGTVQTELSNIANDLAGIKPQVDLVNALNIQIQEEYKHGDNEKEAVRVCTERLIRIKSEDTSIDGKVNALITRVESNSAVWKAAETEIKAAAAQVALAALAVNPAPVLLSGALNNLPPVVVAAPAAQHQEDAVLVNAPAAPGLLNG
jgi:hypothetical protein